MEPKAAPEKEAQSEAGKRGNAIAGRGRPKESGSDNVTPLSQRGNSDTYILRRLKRDRPDLAEKVSKLELSAHAAAVEAGFVQRLIQIAPTVEGFARAICKYLNAEQQRTHEEAGAMGGRGKKAIRITNSFETGTETRGYTLARLKRERPDLAEKVINREITAHAAAVEAGFCPARLVQSFACGPNARPWTICWNYVGGSNSGSVTACDTSFPDGLARS